MTIDQRYWGVERFSALNSTNQILKITAQSTVIMEHLCHFLESEINRDQLWSWARGQPCLWWMGMMKGQA